jgi:hypothetical protein
MFSSKSDPEDESHPICYPQNVAVCLAENKNNNNKICL